MIKNSNIKINIQIFVNCCRFTFFSQTRLMIFEDETPINTSTWLHIVVNIVVNQRIYVYNNGILANGKVFNRESHLKPLKPLNNGQMVVGRYYTNENGYNGTFKIDELIFFNHALTPAEIAVLSQTTA